MTRAIAAPRDQSGDLTALLDLERALSERLAAAHAEAARTVAEARDEAARREAGLDAEVAAARRDLDVRLAKEREDRLGAVTAEAGRRVASWDAVNASSVDRAAAAVVAALIAGSDGGES